MKILIKFKNLALSSFLKKPDLLLESNIFTREEREEIERKVDLYIDNKMYDIVLKYIGNGYKMTQEQHQSFRENIKLLERGEKFKILNKSLGITKFNDELLIENFDSLAIYLNSPNYEKEPLVKLYKEKFKEENFRALIIDNWLKYLTDASRNAKLVDYDTLENNIKTPLKNFGEMVFQNVTINEMNHILTLCNKASKNYKESNYSARYDCMESIITLFREYMKNTCNNDVEQDLKRVRLMYSSNTNIDKLVEQENYKTTSQNNLDKLPKKAKDIIDDIKASYLFLEKNNRDLNEEEIFNLNNLWNKRIPEIIGKYLRADPEFRTSMKNAQGQSIEALMLDSLNNVHDILEEIKKSHTQKLLLDSSSLNRYTKSIKMS